MSKQSNFYRPIILRDALLLATAGLVLLFASPALTQTKTKLPGELWVSGSVEVNGKAAATGLTVFTGYKIKTAEKSGATVNLGKNIGRIKLQPGSEMVLGFTRETIGGELLKGQAIVTAPTGVAINVKTPKGTVASRDRRASTLALEANSDDTMVAAVAGEAFITSDERTETVTAGEKVTVSGAAAHRQNIGANIFGLNTAGLDPAVILATPGRTAAARISEKNP